MRMCLKCGSRPEPDSETCWAHRPSANATTYPSVRFDEWYDKQTNYCRYCGKKLSDAEKLTDMAVCADCFTE